MPTESKWNAAGAGRLLVVAALVGAAFGVLDASHWLVAEMTPSVARRVVTASGYAAILSAVIAVGAAALVELLQAVGTRRGWRLVSEPGSALRWTGWASVVALSVALLAAERRFSAAALDQRRAALAACLLVAVLVGLATAWIARRAPRRALEALTCYPGRHGWWLAIAAVVLVVGLARIATSLPDESATPRRRAASGPPPPNMLLVVADTLRADALGCYGNANAATPVIDGLAARGVLFEEAVAPSSWTLPSVVSVLSSTYPGEHGFVDFVDTLDEDLAYLPEVLARHGYRTFASVGNTTMKEWRGFARGFDFYDAYGYLPESRLVASRLVSGALLLSGVASSAEPGRRPLMWPRAHPPFLGIRWSYYTYDRETNRPLLELLDGGIDEPFFLYLHYLAPHEPYLEHPQPLLDSMPDLEPDNLDELRARYASEVGYLDSALGEMLAALERAGHLDSTIVAFASDHGEAFLEHGRWGHGKDLYQEVLAVPLVLAGPGLPSGKREERRVSLVDLAPTLLALAGIDPPATFRGGSLLRAFDSSAETSGASTPVLAQTSSRMLAPEHRFDAVFDGRFKLIRRTGHDGGEASYELYDLERDPLETRPQPLGPEQAELASLLDSVAAPPTEVREEALSERELEALRALGYVN